MKKKSLIIIASVAIVIIITGIILKNFGFDFRTFSFPENRTEQLSKSGILFEPSESTVRSLKEQGIVLGKQEIIGNEYRIKVTNNSGKTLDLTLKLFINKGTDTPERLDVGTETNHLAPGKTALFRTEIKDKLNRLKFIRLSDYSLTEE